MIDLRKERLKSINASINDLQFIFTRIITRMLITCDREQQQELLEQRLLQKMRVDQGLRQKILQRRADPTIMVGNSSLPCDCSHYHNHQIVIKNN